MTSFRIFAALVLTVLFWSEPAFAQDYIRFPKNTIADTANAAAVTPKSKKKALRRSLWHTLAPSAAGVALALLSDDERVDNLAGLSVGYGLMIGPSMGSLYARDWYRGLNGFVFRSLGVGMVILSESLGDGIIDYGPFGNEHTEHWHDPLTVSEYVGLAGVGIIACGILYNYLTLNRSVDEYNHNLRKGVRIDVAPSYDFKSGTPLVSARISF